MITGLYTALLVTLKIILVFHVVNGRIKNKAALGDAGDDNLQRRIRAHGNLVEFLAPFLIMLLLLEITGHATWILHMLGATFLVSRILHALIITNTIPIIRPFAMIPLIFCMAIPALLLLIDYVFKFVI